MSRLVSLNDEKMRGYYPVRTLDAFQSNNQDEYNRGADTWAFQDLVFHPLHPDLLALRYKNTIEFFNAEEMTAAKTLTSEIFTPCPPSHMAFLPRGIGGDDKQLPIIFSGSMWLSKILYGFDLRQHKIVAQWACHSSSICSIAVCPDPDCPVFLCASEDGQVTLWNYVTMQNEYTYQLSDTGPVVIPPESMSSLGGQMVSVPSGGKPIVQFESMGKIFVMAYGNLISFYNTGKPKTPFRTICLHGAVPGTVPRSGGGIPGLVFSQTMSSSLPDVIQQVALSKHDECYHCVVLFGDQLLLLYTGDSFNVVAVLDIPPPKSEKDSTHNGEALGGVSIVPASLAPPKSPSLCFSPDGNFVVAAGLNDDTPPLFWNISAVLGVTDAFEKSGVLPQIRPQQFTVISQMSPPPSCIEFIPGTAIMVVVGESLGFYSPHI